MIFQQLSSTVHHNSLGHNHDFVDIVEDWTARTSIGNMCTMPYKSTSNIVAIEAVAAFCVFGHIETGNS